MFPISRWTALHPPTTSPLTWKLISPRLYPPASLSSFHALRAMSCHPPPHSPDAPPSSRHPHPGLLFQSQSQSPCLRAPPGQPLPSPHFQRRRGAKLRPTMMRVAGRQEKETAGRPEKEGLGHKCREGYSDTGTGNGCHRD